MTEREKLVKAYDNTYKALSDAEKAWNAADKVRYDAYGAWRNADRALRDYDRDHPEEVKP